MKKLNFCAIALAALPGIVSADTILGVYAGVGSWQSEFSGTLNTYNSPDINVKDDLGINDSSNNMVWAALEHPIPIVPNIKLKSTALEIDGSNSLIRTINFNGSSITIGADVTTNLDLTHTDATLYYEVLDNWISIDLGFTIRKFDGELTMLSNLVNVLPITIDETIPLLYAMGQFELPFSGFYGGFEANAVGFGDSNVTDLTAKLGYESNFRFGAELGYRIIDVTLEDTANLNTDIDVDGFYAAITLHI